MRQDKRNPVATEIIPAAAYHASRFKNTCFYASDRKTPMAKIALEKIKGYGFEIETVTALFDSRVAIPNTNPTRYYHERNHEIESVYFNVLGKIVFEPLGEDFTRIEADCSLGNTDNYPCGGEVVTQVASKAAWRNKYSAIKEIYDRLFPLFKISCTASGECGMHANVSAQCFGSTKDKQTDAIKKLYWLINKDKKSWMLIARCFNRPEDAFNDSDKCYYWSRMTCPDKNWVRNNFDPWRVLDHACALNCTHLNEGRKDSRVEIRLMGGQDSYFSFRNSLETLFHLVDRVTEISWDKIDDWAEVFKGCNQYVLKRLDRCRAEGYLTETDYEKIKATVKPLNLELS